MDIQEYVLMKGIVDSINKYIQIVFWLKVQWASPTKCSYAKLFKIHLMQIATVNDIMVYISVQYSWYIIPIFFK